MRFKIKKSTVAIAISAVLALVGLCYIVLSTDNPRFLEILFLSVAVSLITGLSASLGYVFLRRWLDDESLRPRRKETIILAYFVTVLVLTISIFIFASNKPEPLRFDLPVVYAINCQSKLPPRTIRFDSEEVSHAYRAMISILENFQSADTKNAEIVGQLGRIGSVNPDFEAISLINDLTAYLVPYLLSNLVSTPEMQGVTYREEGDRWLAFPDMSIRGENKKLDQVGGDFKENIFYGYTDWLPITESGIRLPRDTTLHASREGALTSRLLIENDYVTITIGTNVAIFQSGAIAVLDPKHFDQPWHYGKSEHAEAIEKELRSRYYIVKTIVRFDAEFSRFRHGFPRMRRYEQWANDLFALLERKFAWGSLSFTDISDLNLAEIERLGGCF